MVRKPDPRSSRARTLAYAQESRSAPVSLLALIGVCVVVEAVLLLSDLGILPPRLRGFAYQNGGFWIGLLTTWRPNYPAQPYAMFATYAFLHGGVVHLAVNMLTLYSFGRLVIGRIGAWRFLALYAVSALGGAAGFALLSDAVAPMVGASGALFGLAGAWMAWDYVDRYTASVGVLPVLRAALLLVLLNAAMWWAMGGRLAWETHLGGFLAGWIFAFLIDPTSRPRTRD